MLGRVQDDIATIRDEELCFRLFCIGGGFTAIKSRSSLTITGRLESIMAATR